MACFAKTAGRRAKLSKIWDPCILVTHIWGTFDLAWLEIILESFGALVSKLPYLENG